MKKDRAREHTQISTQCTIEATIGDYAGRWRTQYHIDADSRRRMAESAAHWDDERLHHYAPVQRRVVMVKRKWRGWR